MSAETPRVSHVEFRIDLELREDPDTKADHIARTVGFGKPL